MAGPDTPPERRSSSQNSSSSCRSQKAKAIRAKSQKRHSGSSNATTTDLTSFPSLSPDRSPEGFSGQPALNRALTNALLEGGGGNSANDAGRGRKTTLAKLTNSGPHTPGRAALFDDSISAGDFPGALHLADDAHIERLVGNTGAVKLVRQFARDLAQRDAEISTLRQRADARERELKRMLREVSVSNKDIERRLYAMENPPEKQLDKNGDGSADRAGQASKDINGLMHEAMTDGVGSYVPEELLGNEPQSTIRPHRLESGSRSGASSLESNNNRKRQSSVRGWQDYFFGSTSASRKTSRASSVMSDVGEVEEGTGRGAGPNNPSARRKALDGQLFQRPEGPAGSTADVGGKRLTGTSNGDDASIRSRKSSKSLSSWTVKLFAGNSQGKDAGHNENNHNSSAGKEPKPSSTHSGGPKSGMSAVAALKRINSNTSMNGSLGRSLNGSSGTVKVNPQGRRGPSASVSQGTNDNADKTSTNLGPVEMDAILPLESRPPTLTHTYNNYQPGDLLTDRFGFIYDQRRNKRQREANIVKSRGNRPSVAETLGAFRSDASDGEEEPDSRTPVQHTYNSHRSPAAASPEDPETGTIAIRRWQDYLKFPTKPTELLSHTPSTAPIVSLTTGNERQHRSASISVERGGSLSVPPNAQPSASTSTVVADSPEFAVSHTDEPAATASGTNENEPVKLLLEQLTDLHDSLQRDRTVRWNEFLRKVRAERRKDGEAAAAAAAASDRPTQSVDMPEVSLADGEMIGIAGLGNKGKVGRAKWREFRVLVLGGVPVALRAKVWSECSGASAMRVPGYYDDLVKGAGGSEPDHSVMAQIDADINRTLTDNVFFRKGPGVAKLQEVLLAYSRRNPEVGYCQGMNLIAASLLLVMPTAEDAFWILASMVEIILPQHYYDHGLLASRADQVVLRQYISQVLPKLSAHLDTLGIELEALTFQWFLSVFTDCLSAEALYRVWDVVLCLNVTSTVNSNDPTGSNTPTTPRDINDPSTSAAKDIASGSGGGSTFLFQVALALLKLNEHQLLTSCDTPAALYTYVNHQMTNHAISIDGLIQASEGLRNVVRREDVVARRTVALRDMREFSADTSLSQDAPSS